MGDYKKDGEKILFCSRCQRNTPHYSVHKKDGITDVCCVCGMRTW